MIRVLIKPAVILTCLWIVLILGFNFLGTFKSNPMMPLFTNPDGSRCEMPCLFGIQAGITTIEEAITLIQHHPLTHNLRLVYKDDEVSIGTYRESLSYFGYSAYFFGQGGQVVIIQIDPYVYQNPDHTNDPNAKKVINLCLRSRLNNGTMVFPQIGSALSRMWHSSSFNLMLTTLGPPTTLSHPAVLPANAWDGNHIESFYYNERLVITHSNDIFSPPDFDHNFFGSICLYYEGTLLWRRNTGFHARVGGVLPWLGLFATVQQYQDWAAQNPVCFREPCTSATDP